MNQASRYAVRLNGRLTNGVRVRRSTGMEVEVAFFDEHIGELVMTEDFSIEIRDRHLAQALIGASAEFGWSSVTLIELVDLLLGTDKARPTNIPKLNLTAEEA